MVGENYIIYYIITFALLSKTDRDTRLLVVPFFSQSTYYKIYDRLMDVEKKMRKSISKRERRYRPVIVFYDVKFSQFFKFVIYRHNLPARYENLLHIQFLMNYIFNIFSAI